MTAAFSLELLNGAWAIAAASLLVICALYLWHESQARKIMPFGMRRRLTAGMRVSIAISAISAGVLIRSAETWRWRFSGAGFEELSQLWLNIGGWIAVIGFICATRELSRDIFGPGPWAWTLAAEACFLILTITHRLL